MKMTRMQKRFVNRQEKAFEQFDRVRDYPARGELAGIRDVLLEKV